MKKIISLIGFFSILLSFIGEGFAYRVPAGMWFDTNLRPSANDTTHYRIYNPYGTDIFVPGRDDAGTLRSGDWYSFSWGGNRRGSIRLHSIYWPGAGITNCPNSTVPDSAVNYASTPNGWAAMGGLSTVMKSGDWANRLQFNTQLAYDGEMRCDIKVNYNY